MQEMRVRALGRDHPLEKEMATHQYSCHENPRDRGARWATVHGVAKRQAQLCNWARKKKKKTKGRQEEEVVWLTIHKFDSAKYLVQAQCLPSFGNWESNNWLLLVWWLYCVWLSTGSAQFSCSVVSYSLWTHGLQHPMFPYPSPTPWLGTFKHVN